MCGEPSRFLAYLGAWPLGLTAPQTLLLRAQTAGVLPRRPRLCRRAPPVTNPPASDHTAAAGWPQHHKGIPASAASERAAMKCCVFSFQKPISVLRLTGQCWRLSQGAEEKPATVPRVEPSGGLREQGVTLRAHDSFL